MSPINGPCYYLPELVLGKAGYDDGGLFVGIVSKNGLSNDYSRDLVEVPVTKFGKSVCIQGLVWVRVLNLFLKITCLMSRNDLPYSKGFMKFR